MRDSAGLERYAIKGAGRQMGGMETRIASYIWFELWNETVENCTVADCCDLDDDGRKGRAAPQGYMAQEQDYDYY